LNRELVHRGRNTIAVAQAIVSQTLRADKSAAIAINGRLRALLNTNEILTTFTLQTGLLRQVIEAEVTPYGLERISLSGPPVTLQPDLARTFALVIHELATNAAKYGSLSSATGAWRSTGTSITTQSRSHGWRAADQVYFHPRRSVFVAQSSMSQPMKHPLLPYRLLLAQKISAVQRSGSFIIVRYFDHAARPPVRLLVPSRPREFRSRAADR
jgi:hypothetical protein